MTPELVVGWAGAIALISLAVFVAALWGQMEAKPSPDLESVRRLIEETERYQTYPVSGVQAVRIVEAARAPAPALQPLLAEVAQFRSTNALLEAQVTSLAEKVGDLAIELAEKRAKVKNHIREATELNRQLTDAINSREYWKQLYKDTKPKET